MRDLKIDNLLTWRINGTQYLRDKHCKLRKVVCFKCEKGLITKVCFHWGQGIDGLRCDDKSIKKD